MNAKVLQKISFAGSIGEVGDDIIRLIRRVIGGELTKAEQNGQNGIVCMYTQHTAF